MTAFAEPLDKIHSPGARFDPDSNAQIHIIAALGWLRRRLRALLRKRQKRPGYGMTQGDHQAWPNRWFAERGLFSLEHGSCNYG